MSGEQDPIPYKSTVILIVYLITLKARNPCPRRPQSLPHPLSFDLGIGLLAKQQLVNWQNLAIWPDSA